MENFVYIEPSFNVIKFEQCGKTYWKLHSIVELPSASYVTSRYFTTQGQAFLALGIIESVYKQGESIDGNQFDFIIKAANRLISGKDWITE